MRSLFTLALLCAASGTGCYTTLTAPAGVLAQEKERLARQPPAEGDATDDSDWRALLAADVGEDGRVDYAALAGRRAPLERCVARLALTGPVTTPERYPTNDDRLAYYLNAYNALVLFNVLSRPRLESVADHKYDFFWFTCFQLDGSEINLYDLENDVIRGRFHDPRVHMQLNCGSLSCPVLARVPYTGVALQQQLAAQTSRFLHEPSNVDVDDGVIVLSQIFEWYAEDFPPDPVRWIATQAPDLKLPVGAPVRYRPYDWGLNAPAGALQP